MKKIDELRPEYKKSDFVKLERGKFHKAVSKGTSVALIDPALAKAFPTSEAVNAALLGFLFKDVITAYLFSVEVVAAALLVGGLVILVAEQALPKARSAEGDEVTSIGWRTALTIGLCQCFALIPGTSRSLATILGGRVAGLSHAASTEFSFLVGLLTLSAASLYKMWSLGPALTQVYPAGPAGVGLLVAAVTAFVSVKWLVGYVSRNGLGVFAWYRIALGGAILAYLAMN